MKKLLVIGHGRHGKDTVSEMLKKRGFVYESSSSFCNKLFIYERLKNVYNYSSLDDCFHDRHNKRTIWYNLIKEYCGSDLARVGRKIFQENDIYCGLRNLTEFQAIKREKLFDFCVWVDRSEILPPEPTESMTLTPDVSDFIINNNGTIADLETEVRKLLKHIDY